MQVQVPPETDDRPSRTTLPVTNTRPQFSVRSNFSVQNKIAAPVHSNAPAFPARSKPSPFEVQVHHRQGAAPKGTGLDQTFSKFREGRFDSWTHSQKPANREEPIGALPQSPRYKEDTFDTRAYDARAQGYLGSRQATARAQADNPINLDDLESRAIQEALETCRGNVSAAARMLGISRNTIYRRLNSK
nr:helix-turn-helix domain-containing protein [Limnobacter sp. 130]